MNITAYIGRMVDALGWRPSERQLVWARAADSRTDIGDIDRMRLVALSRKLYLNNPIVKGSHHRPRPLFGRFGIAGPTRFG